MKRLRYILLFLFVCLSIFQNANASFRHLNVEDGLSSRQTYQIEKDSAGFLWIFTSMGIDRYDGTEFRQYRLDENIESKDRILSSSGMTCDNNGRLWVSIKNRGIYYYDYTTDDFILKFKLSDYFREPPALNHIYFDDRNRLWICLSNGLYRLDPESGHIKEIPEFTGINVTTVIRHNNTFYVGACSHLFFFHENRDEDKPFTVERIKFETDRIEYLHINKNLLYIGTFSNSAFILNPESGQIFSLRDIIPSVPVRSIKNTKDDEIWFGTDGGGVYVIDSDSRRLKEKYLSDEDEAGNLSGNTISDILVDERNCIWISTSTNGISIFDPQSNYIRWTKHEYKNTNSLLSNHVNVILEDSEGDLWYGTNNGISLHRKKQDRWSHFLNNKNDMDNSSMVVLALCEDNLNRIWAGGYGIGAYCIDKKSGQIKQIEKYNPLSDTGIATDYIFACYAENEFVWMGGIEGRLTRYNTKTKSYAYFPYECIGDMKAGAENLILATCNGLGFFDRATDELRLISTFNGSTLQYPVRCLLKSSAGEIWMATDGDGLIRYNPATGFYKLYQSDDVIKSNVINGVAEDAWGRIWFTTEKDLYRITPDNNDIICMNEFIGVEWGYFNSNACITLKNKNLAFGTAKGVVEFSPDIKLELRDSLPVIFTDFKLSYESVKAAAAGSPLKKSINETSSFSLTYKQNSFSICFSSVNFVHPHQTEYIYKLENSDLQWKASPPTRHHVEYMSLAPGRYTFRLKAINKYTKKIIGERSIEITIGRPHWASWWAISSYILFSVLFFYLIVQYIRNRIARHDAKERIRFFIDVAHDIRIPISLIKAPLSEIDAKEALSEHGHGLLSVAMQNAEKLFMMVSQLLDLQKIDLSAEKLMITPQNIRHYIHEKINSFRMAAVQKGIRLELNIREPFPEIGFDKIKMDKVMDNILSNAIKYTEKGYVRVDLDYSGHEWFIKIKDTGIGIPAHEQKHLFKGFYRAGNAVNSSESGSGIGLILARKLIRLMQGEITFSSKENEGSLFVISFPLKMNNPFNETVRQKMTPDKSGTPKQEKEILLLAEDNEDMREYLKTSLSAKFNVVDVSNGKKALELARELNPAIIISDVIMPEMRGDEVCRILKSSVETSHIPFILLSALSEKENVIFGLESGANDYIIKPFDFAILQARIRSIIQDREALRKKLISAETGLDELNYTSQLDKKFLDKAIRIIEEELSNPEFSINEFCKALCMSRTSVYNKIKTLTNQSPNDFIRIIRLNKAKEFLKTRQYTITEIAYMTGFSDPKYFSTSFKKHFGTSPSKMD
jgi:signal transduction histidine kinase/ligand-binding sensor domain-containing protein/DNA-binding response OmpR family regulator